MKRKCFECGEYIEFDKDTINKVIRFEKIFYHHDCFISACKRKSKSSRALPKWGEALESIDKIQQETKDFFVINSNSPKDKLYRFLLANYDVSSISSYTFVKLEEVYTGKRKGLAYAIPPEDLLDMWEQKKKSGCLDRLRAKNIVRGKDMNEEQKINYDLAYLISKYNDYLKWKERNKIIEQDVNKVNEDNLKSVDLDKLSKVAQNQQKEEEEDIDSLLEELFD